MSIRRMPLLQSPPVTQKCGSKGWIRIWTRSFSAHLPASAEARRKPSRDQDQSEGQGHEKTALNTALAIDRSVSHVTRLPGIASGAHPRQGRPISNSIEDIGNQLELMRSAGRPWRQIAADTGKPEASIRKLYSRYLMMKKLGPQDWAAVRETAGRPYTLEEDEKLLELKRSGLDWAGISIEMNRSPRACETRYYCKYVRGRNKQEGQGVSIAVPERPTRDASTTRSPIDSSETSGPG